ncbi:MAG: VOC family protein [Candidatus Limnocylindria bacterium]
MPTGIDHVVIAVADPDAAAAELTERVGLAFTGGGRHPGLGTFNRLAFLGDAYLELIGVEDAAAAQGWSVGRAAVRSLERGGGFVTYALADDGIRGTVARLQANGSSIGPVVHGSRQGSDGEAVEWWTATPPELGPELPPFLIKHAAWGVEWGTEAMDERRAFVHPLGTPASLIGLELEVRDPVALAASWVVEAGMMFAWFGATLVATIGRHVIRLVAAGNGLEQPTAWIAASVDRPRATTTLGLRFIVRP